MSRLIPMWRLPPTLLATVHRKNDLSRRIPPALARMIVATAPFAKKMSTYARIVPSTQKPTKSKLIGLSSRATVATEHLLPLDLFTGPIPGSVNAKKLLNNSSSYLIHGLMDITTNGYVTPSELQAGLASLGLKLNSKQVDILLERYDDAPRNGLFERNELVPLFDHLKLHTAVGSAAKVLRGVEAHEFFVRIGAISAGRPLETVKAEYDLVKALKGSCPKYITYCLFDKNDNGFITPEELASGLASLGTKVTDDELSLLVERYDDNKNGVLEPNELIPMFDDLIKYKSVAAALKADSFERVFGACAKYLTYAAFEKHQTHGHITPWELKKGLAFLGKNHPGIVSSLERTDDEIDEIVSRYGSNNVMEQEDVSRFIDDFFAAGSIDALLAATAPKSDGSADHMPWQVNHKLLSYSSKYLTHSLLDSNSLNGYITPEELRAGLRALGVRMSDAQFDLLADKYDLDGNLVFDREELEPLFDDLKIHVLLCGYP